MPLSTWLTFFLASWAISFSPGAGAISAMSSGLKYGFARGYWNTAGLIMGIGAQNAHVLRTAVRGRHVLLLSQLHGLTYAQIGPRLGLAEVTVRRHMARAIAACCALDADLR